jgi:hypothetical protein
MIVFFKIRLGNFYLKLLNCLRFLKKNQRIKFGFFIKILKY